MSETVVATDRLTKRYGDRLAVDSVDLTVRRGEVYGFLGPNGAGKTTTLRMLLGLVRPSAGAATVLGAAPGSRTAVAGTGALVEGPGFYPYLSGRDNLRVLARYRGLDHREVDRVLDRVDLAERSSDRFKTYSLGMKQRLGVAAALLGEPDLLVLDEPTNGLDPAGMLEFRTMIRNLVDKEGRTVFISSHILDEVQKMADDIAIVQAGRLISWGPVDELIAAGRHSVLLRVDDEERARGVLSGISFITGVGTNEGYDALDLEVADISDERLIAINRTLVEAGVGVAEIWRESETLEQRFLDLTADSKPGDMSPVRKDDDAGV